EGITSTEDSFHFLYQSLPGDLQLVTQTTNFQGGFYRAQSGPMLRAGLAADAPFVMLQQNASGEIVFTYRRKAGAEAEYGASAGWQVYGAWMLLRRAGGAVL